MLAEGMSEADIIEDFPELETADIRACLAFAADRDTTPTPWRFNEAAARQKICRDVLSRFCKPRSLNPHKLPC